MANSFRFFHITILTITIFLTGIIGCSHKTSIPDGRPSNNQTFLSAYYNHFEGGILFTDVQAGLNVLWNASFKNGRPYKENIGLIIPGGIFILPNYNNTVQSSRFEVTLITADHNVYAEGNGLSMQVLAIVHTHPNPVGVSEPTPKKDYQMAYLGVHNYVISHHHLYDAYYDSNGNEVFDQLESMESILLLHSRNMAGFASTNK